MSLNRVEQAVLAAYQDEAAQLCRRKALCLDKNELAAKTGFSPSRCAYARASLVAKGVLRKMGCTVPMKVELL